MAALTVALPPLPTDKATGAKGGGAGAGSAPQQPDLVTIEGIVDTIEVMASLQKPKKVRAASVLIYVRQPDLATNQPTSQPTSQPTNRPLNRSP